MSLIPELSNPYLTSFASGLLYGLVACTATCLPYLASYIAGTGADFRKGFFTTLTFNSGRIVAYTLIGAVIGVFSGLIHFFTQDSNISIFQAYSTLAFSIVTIVIGASLLYKNRKPCEINHRAIKPKRFAGKFEKGAFTLGLSRGLVLCPPLLTLLVYSVPFAGPVDSVLFAVLFGIGTSISPMLVLGGVTGWLLNKAPLLRTYIAFAGAAVLILLGVSTLISSILLLA
ncbi:MAG: sulfite exporter TauE/SafE family protein [Candidatus Bathyarchaeia archaeon]|jgi:thiol:disulfide interchange protein DsbD